ncbi:hypothetical protein ACFVAJ_18800 [Agromyces sp. NPDC057679]|uniref:hypothetical protein n=1 Tax=Agromyces sp. NPDC057679 TaxID=3346207 RepID=UPI0036731C42
MTRTFTRTLLAAGAAIAATSGITGCSASEAAAPEREQFDVVGMITGPSDWTEDANCTITLGGHGPTLGNGAEPAVFYYKSQTVGVMTFGAFAPDGTCQIKYSVTGVPIQGAKSYYLHFDDELVVGLNPSRDAVNGVIKLDFTVDELGFLEEVQ